MNYSSIAWSMLWGALGLFYLRQAKLLGKWSYFFAGMGLLAFPYFVDKNLWLALIGLGLAAAPYFF